ncbi:hypothetical protein F5B22DRAFT_551255 [Xylaria bambusicola]|uniref:uncharacterized protein n=1 Tax=Xylaria bambusicola TaxID=326684 RepID=UPI002007EE06|nr:uncharacterized protein F5B22DRAFT_551255 [Xylaria bambusicola]KAI0503392.1 hypothetical protein F5B22DRAFT_551255 [Xylaria bambusicola]
MARPGTPAFLLTEREQRVGISSVPDGNIPSSRPMSRATTLDIPDDNFFQDTSNMAVHSIEPVPAPRLPIKESLGRSGSLTIIGGSVVALVLLGFLMFLWLGHGGHESADATWVWRQIALGGWMTQSITLTSLGLRFIISMQAAVCTSMLAALVLEKKFTPKPDVAWFSIIRSTNDGPLKMVQMMLSSKFLIWSIEFWLLSLLAVTTLGLQFASTILLSDIVDSAIVSNMRQTQMPDLFDPSGADLSVINWLFGASKPVYGVFGELDTDYNVLPDARGLSQTGLVQRAFLPLDRPNDRISTRYFKGNAIVMSSKTACMRPRIYGISLTHYTDDLGNHAIEIEGRLQYELTIRGAQVDANSSCSLGECEEIAFLCSSPIDFVGHDNSTTSWQSVACYLGAVGGQIDWSLHAPRWNSSQQPWSRNVPISLILSTNVEDVHQLQGHVEDPPWVDNGEWRSYEIATGVRVNISLCFHAFTADRKLVSMAASWDLEEPITQWSFGSFAYDVSDVERQIGSNLPRGSSADRGVLDLHILGEPHDGPPTSPANTKWRNGCIMRSLHMTPTKQLGSAISVVMRPLAKFTQKLGSYLAIP